MKRETNQSGSRAATCSALDAGGVAAGPTEYVVTHTHGHRSLRLGDVVVMGETPRRRENVLIRVADMTIHDIVGEHDQYVHLEANR